MRLDLPLLQYLIVLVGVDGVVVGRREADEATVLDDGAVLLWVGRCGLEGGEVGVGGGGGS